MPTYKPNSQGAFTQGFGTGMGGSTQFKIVRGPDGGFYKIPAQYNTLQEAYEGRQKSLGLPSDFSQVKLGKDNPNFMQGTVTQNTDNTGTLNQTTDGGPPQLGYQIPQELMGGQGGQGPQVPTKPIPGPQEPIPTRTPSTILGGGEGSIPEGVRTGDYVPAHNLAFPPAPPNFFRDPYGIGGQPSAKLPDVPYIRRDQGMPTLGQSNLPPLQPGQIPPPTPRSSGVLDWLGITNDAENERIDRMLEENNAAKQASLEGAGKARGAFVSGQSDAARVLHEGTQEAGRIENYLANQGIQRQERGLQTGIDQSNTLYNQGRADINRGLESSNALYEQGRGDINQGYQRSQDLYNQARQDVQPYRQAEQQALSAMPQLQNVMGLGQGGQEAVRSALENDPAFQYRNMAAERDISRMLRARGINQSETGTKMAAEATDRIRAEAADAYRNRLQEMSQMGLQNAGLAGREALAQQQNAMGTGSELSRTAMGQGQNVLGAGSELGQMATGQGQNLMQANLQGGQNIGGAYATLGSNLGNRMGDWSKQMGDTMANTGVGLAQSYTGEGNINAQSSLNAGQIQGSKQPNDLFGNLGKLYQIIKPGRR